MESEESQSKFSIPLIFAFLTIPFLLDYCQRQDCYAQKSDCDTEWGASECEANPDKTCQYISKPYYFRSSSLNSSRSGEFRKGQSTSPVRRSVFGRSGRSYFSGGS